MERNGIMEITGPQQKQLRKAFLNAFPTHQDLEMMVFDQLNEHVSSIAGGGTLEHTVFELIKWALAREKLEELVIAALKQNPSPQLVDVANQLGIWREKMSSSHLRDPRWSMRWVTLSALFCLLLAGIAVAGQLLLAIIRFLFEKEGHI